MLSSLIALFFPRNCVACDHVLRKHEATVCNLCKLKITNSSIKYSNQHPIANQLHGRVAVSGAFALHYFSTESPLHQILHAFKYKGDKDVGAYFGELLKKELQHILKDVDWIIPVPLHPEKEFQRGYNQSTIIAKAIDQDKLRSKVTIRIKNTATQTQKSRADRWENVKDAFQLVEKIPEDVKHVLIVDDVVTTGSTVEALSKTLLKHKELKISIASIAYA